MEGGRRKVEGEGKDKKENSFLDLEFLFGLFGFFSFFFDLFIYFCPWHNEG